MIRVDLSRSPKAFLLVEETAGTWRVALWRLRDPVRDPKGEAPPMPFQAAVERGDIARGAKASAWLRRAGEGRSLELVLEELLEGEVHEPKTVAWYVEERAKAPA